jgi:hypothetical protein
MLVLALLGRLAPPSGGVFTLRGTTRKRASSSGEDAAAALTEIQGRQMGFAPPPGGAA